MDFKTVGFIGLGLLGGSIAKAIHLNHPTLNIIATSGHASTIQEAYAEHIIVNQNLLELNEFSSCDVIFLCCPTRQNIEYLSKLKPFLKEGCILTDIGSVKGDIHKAAEALELNAFFIGGHPMTGSELIGFQNSSPYLLENAYYILTPSKGVSPDKVKAFLDFISSLSAITIVLDENEHDFATAAISHLPHIIASGLVNLVGSYPQEDLLKQIAAGGFRDITRIASSSPVMWQNICMSNREQILRLLEEYEIILKSMHSLIKENDSEAILQFFSSAKDFRDSLYVHKNNIFSSIYAFYCDLIDEAGGIATIATILASNNLNIKNIGIIHNREFEQGVLKIELYDEKALHRAIDLLTKYHYTIHEQ